MIYTQLAMFISSIFIAIFNKDDKRFLGGMSILWGVIAALAGILGK